MKKITLILVIIALLTIAGCKDDKQKNLYLPEAKNDKIYTTIGGESESHKGEGYTITVPEKDYHYEKEYDVYFGGYTNNGAGFGQPTSTTSHYVNKKVLIHKLKTGGCLVIEVDGNNIEISEQLLNDLTNVDIMNKEYK